SSGPTPTGSCWRHPVVRPDSDRQLLAHPPVSAEPAGAVSGCRYGPMRENPWLAATGTVAPPLSRRGLRSWHPGKKTPGCKEQRRFANRASRRCGGSLLIACRVPHTRMSPCRRGLIQPQPAALTVQGK
ncbi:TPA: hypothetical protein PDZ04_005212, partial [Escherichia coli]|nr:hypothetical protein [Escherichia coli]